MPSANSCWSMTPTAPWPIWARKTRNLNAADDSAGEDLAAAEQLAAEMSRDPGGNRKPAGAADRRTGGMERQEGQPGTRPRSGHGSAGNQHQPAGRRARRVWMPRWKAPRTRPTCMPPKRETERARGGSRNRPRRRREARAPSSTDAEAAEAAAREPLEAAEREVQRLSAEVKALSDLLHPEGEGLFPPLVDAVHGAVRLRSRAGRRAGRRPAGAAGQFLAASLARSGRVRFRSGAAGRRQAAERIRQGAGGAGPPPGHDRSGVPRPGRGAAESSSSPASGWCRRAAMCGAGMALSPPPMRRPLPPCACRSATASPPWKAKSNRPSEVRAARFADYSAAKEAREAAREALRDRRSRRNAPPNRR